MEVIETDVTVVGSGPTGVMLAYELALAGVNVTVIDKLNERPIRSTEVAVPVRAVELLEQRGLLAEVEERAHTKLPDAHFSQLPVLLHYDGWHTRHPYALGLAHHTLVEILESRLEDRFGLRVQRGHELTAVEQGDDGVTATVQRPAGELTIRSRYLVGCDGGQSTVRKLAEIPFPGTDGKVTSLAAEVRVVSSAELPSGQWRSVEQLFHQNKSTNRFAVLIPQPGGLHRLAGADLTDQPADQDAPVTREEVRDLVRKTLPDDVEIAEVLWASRFTDATRQAERYRSGRILLAGDAAHINFPANGQGLNLGMQDAVNLGWKLAAQIHGWAPADLLDSYQVEQHPVAARALDNTRVQVDVMFPTPDNEPLRRTFITLLEIPEVNRYMAGLVAGLDTRYPIDAPDHALLGARMVDMKLSVAGDKRWFSELLHEGRGALVTSDRQYVEVATPWLPRITVTEVAELPEVVEDAVLVRPDGYVCWVAADIDGTSQDSLRRLPIALGQWFGA